MPCLMRKRIVWSTHNAIYENIEKWRNYSGSVVKTKIRVFYNELIRLISYKEQGEDIGAPP